MLYQTLKLHNGRSDVTLTTYILQPNEFMPEGKRPAVLICPGGGYLVCSDGEGEPIAIAFNRMGYNAFVLRYSVYSGVSGSSESVAAPGANGPSAVREPRDHCVFPNPMLDVKAAMEEIQRNAVQWNTDPSGDRALRLFSWGTQCGDIQHLLETYGNAKADRNDPGISSGRHPRQSSGGNV